MAAAALALATNSTTVHARYVEIVQKLCFADLPTHTPVWYKIFRSMPPFNGVLLAISFLRVFVGINVNARGQKLLL